ncbi:GntR family transcriptional regulator [Actinopolymorpha sp. B11F2]|uniref:GntR family transcriptional regulator n=1 Tax=Actinopolymorpha sp. B11F2 TaxID=3160862 RepID=UPI0032E51AAC
MVGSVRTGNDEPPALQVYRIVAGAIARGAFGAGSRLPPERELSSRVGVSRATLRVALRALADDGLVEARQGRGWHVTAMVEEGEEMPLSFTEIAAARDLRASAEVLEQDTRTATIDEAEQLGVAPGSEVFCLDRLRKLDDVPIALASARLPVNLAAAATSLDYTNASLYAALRERCDVHPVRASYVLQAKGVTGREAELLGLDEGESVLVGDYRCFDQLDRTFEIGRITYRGDRYRFRANLRDRRASLPRAVRTRETLSGTKRVG